MFALRGRAGVLTQLEAPPVILHVLESEGRKLPYEARARLWLPPPPTPLPLACRPPPSRTYACILCVDQPARS